MKMKQVLSVLLICMLIVEFVLLTIWILAYCGLSPIPQTPIPMQLIALIALVICTVTTLWVHIKGR